MENKKKIIIIITSKEAKTEGYPKLEMNQSVEIMYVNVLK